MSCIAYFIVLDVHVCCVYSCRVGLVTDASTYIEGCLTLTQCIAPLALRIIIIIIIIIISLFNIPR